MKSQTTPSPIIGLKDANIPGVEEPGSKPSMLKPQST